MIKRLLAILIFCHCTAIHAQTIKTDVLVIGCTPSAVAAAIQSARSKVKTILISENSTPGYFPRQGACIIETGKNLHQGIWGEFRSKVQDFYKKTPGYDTSYNASLKFAPDRGDSILQNLCDTTKNLSQQLNSKFLSIKKDGDHWEAIFSQNGKTVSIKTRVVIDATETGEVAIKAGGKIPPLFDYQKDKGASNAYRTSIATGDYLAVIGANDLNAPKNNYPPYPSYYIPMKAVIVAEVDNILVTEKTLPGLKSIQYLPVQLSLGQGVGTIAAYCAFYKITTKNLKVRVIQGELLDFKGFLLPFSDVTQRDYYWRAVQQVAATGMLRGVQQIKGNEPQFLFRPDSVVNTAEIKPVLTEIYTRAFLWFNKEKTGEKFTLGNLISFISDYTLTDPDVLKSKLQKAWKTEYKFKLEFDLKRPVTRLEFAVLANRYLNPFARTVDLDGRLVN